MSASKERFGIRLQINVSTTALEIVEATDLAILGLGFAHVILPLS